jgi:hypothetical protein
LVYAREAERDRGDFREVVRGYLLNLCSPDYCCIWYIMSQLAILEIGIHIVIYLFQIMKGVYDDKARELLRFFLQPLM